MNYSSWNHKPHGECDLTRLRSLEKSLGTNLPADFHKWLIQVNGGKPKCECIKISAEWGESQIATVYGLNDGPNSAQIDNAHNRLSGNLEQGFLAFANDPGGNQFTVCLQKKAYGKILFWDHETGDFYSLANDIESFQKKLFECNTHQSNLEKILRNDDIISLKYWLTTHSIEETNRVNRTPLEDAAIYGSVNCIRYLHSVGANARQSLEFANKNLKYFPEHQETVDLLQELYPEKA